MNSSWARARIRFRSSEGWKAKSKPARVLMVTRRPILSAAFDAAGFAQGEFLAEHGVDRFQRADLAALELAHRVVEDFQGPRHFEPDQMSAHLVDGARRRLVASHGRPPSPARRRATAS